LRKVSFPIKIGFKNRLDINLKKVGNDKPQEGKRMCLKNTTVGGVGNKMADQLNYNSPLSILLSTRNGFRFALGIKVNAISIRFSFGIPLKK